MQRLVIQVALQPARPNHSMATVGADNIRPKMRVNTKSNGRLIAAPTNAHCKKAPLDKGSWHGEAVTERCATKWHSGEAAPTIYFVPAFISLTYFLSSSEAFSPFLAIIFTIALPTMAPSA